MIVFGREKKKRKWREERDNSVAPELEENQYCNWPTLPLFYLGKWLGEKKVCGMEHLKLFGFAGVGYCKVKKSQSCWP